MDISNGNQDYRAIHELIRRAQIEREAALGVAIGAACAAAWRAIAGRVGGTHQGERA